MRQVHVLLVLLSLLGVSSLWAEVKPIGNPVTVACPSDTRAQGLVPTGAIWKREKHHPGRETPPPNFHTVISHITVANALPCALAGVSKVSIRSWKVYEQRGGSAGPKRLVQTITFDGKGLGGVGSGGIFPRINDHGTEKWYGETDGTQESVRVYDYEGKTFNIDPGKIARRLYHNWSDPRLDNQPGARYLVEMEVRITGPARLQIGLDWWRGMQDAYGGFDLECQDPKSKKNQSSQPANNCEAWMSDWYGDTGGRFITLRAPRAYWN